MDVERKIIRYSYNEVGSTNDVVKELVQNSAATTDAITIVTANHQTKGRGRLGKEWKGNANENVYCSIAIPAAQITEEMNYQAVGCLAVWHTLRQMCPLCTVVLKYPNDVYIKAADTFKKVSGVLVEQEFLASKRTLVIVGIGINVGQRDFSNELKDKATSLEIAGCTASVCGIVEKLVDNFLWKTTQTVETLNEEWHNLLNLEEKSIHVIGSDEIWNVKRIERDGRLLVKNSKNESRIIDNGDSILYDLTPAQ